MASLLLMLAGCAGALNARRAHEEEAALAGWRALEEGRAEEAARVFEARLTAAPTDLLARFGRATLAYEHGEPAVALDDYADLLDGAARGTASPGVAALLAPVAAARALALTEDVAPSVRARAERRLLALPDGAALPWQARLELARLADRAARRAGDAGALELSLIHI